MGIGKPHSNLRIVALGGTGSSSAPMLRRVWGYAGFTSRSKASTFLAKANGITVAGNMLWIMYKYILPDIIIKAGASKGTDGVFESTFHELAHASHFKKVGSGYWIKYINYIVTYGAYGDGHGKNHELVGLGEAWGYHVGHFLAIKEFGNNNKVLTLNAFENFEPREKPDNIAKSKYRDTYGNTNSIGWTGWIPAGIMYDLMDTHIDVVRSGFNDNASGYTIKNLYDALDSGVESPQKFRDRLLSENNNRDTDDVKELFKAYYWD